MLLADQPIELGDWKISPTFESRVRWERRLDRDFLEGSSDNATSWLFRARLGFVATDKNGNKIVLVYQRAYDDQNVAYRTNPVHNSDVINLYWEKKTGDWTLTLGRWPYKLGDGRLICNQGAWGNLGRTFEGGLVKSKVYEFAVFKEAVNTPSNKEMTTALASAKTEFGQTSFIYRANERTVLDTDIYTLNHIYKKSLNEWLITLEGSYQWGENNGRDHDAFAVTAQASRSFGKNVKGYVEGSLVSGGSGSKSRTFDPLYQSAVPPYGVRAQVGFRNLVELTFGGSWQVDKKLKVDGVLTFVNLFDAKDGWYGLTGSLNKKPGGSYIDPTGASGKKVGSFVQIEAGYLLTKRDTLGAGIGVFLPGPYVEAQLGRSPSNQLWGYVSYTYKF